MGKLRTVISQEMLTVSNKRLLGAESLAIIESMHATVASGGAPTEGQLDKLTAVIKRRTGMDITVVYNDYPIINASAQSWNLQGHNGLGYGWEGRGAPVDITGAALDNKLFDLDINLSTGMVTGALVKVFPMVVTLYGGLFLPDNGFTARETTGVLMHEVGHCYGVFAALGDYVWLNYMLTEGVEVVLGTKANRYKLQVCNMSYIESLVTDPKLREELKNAPTEEAVRRAVLTTWRMMPRHHMTSGGSDNSIRRDEQFADWYATRQGFGRDLVTMQAKSDRLDRSSGSYTRTGASWIWAETMKVTFTVMAVLTLPILPISVVCMAVVASLANHSHERYDNPTERILKVRRDLIAQLKSAEGDVKFKAALDHDIRMVDDVLKNYNTNRTAWEVISQALFKSDRRQAQLKRQDETLEGLLNNDAFLMAQRFTTLK